MPDTTTLVSADTPQHTHTHTQMPASAEGSKLKPNPNSLPSIVSAARSERPKFGPYQLKQTLGEGQFGKVKLATDTRSERMVAIKFLKKARVRDNADRRKIMREIAMLQMLDHPFVVSLLEVVETASYIGLVLEYAPGGELFHYIMAQPSGHLGEREGCKFFAQLAAGVSYMHFMGIVHRDLKLENLLLGPDNNILISDFGFANTSSEHMATQCGSPSYAAPELVSNADYVGVSVDIWSCGVILYGMLCGYLPYDDDPSNPDSENIQRLYQYIRTTVLTYPPFISNTVRHLMSIMLVPNPQNRAKMSDILSHSWLAPESEILSQELQRRLKQVGQSTTPTSSNDSPSASPVPYIPAPRVPSVPITKSEPDASMQRTNSVSSKMTNWFWSKSASSNNATITPIHPNSKSGTSGGTSVFGIAFGASSATDPETAAPRTSVSAVDRPDATERQSMSYSLTNSDFTDDGGVRERKLAFHSGALDQRALSSRDPLELLTDIEAVFVQRYNWVIESNGASSGEYKLKVKKPRGMKIHESGSAKAENIAPVAAAAEGMSKVVDIKREVINDAKMAQIYSGFPVSLKSKITKFMHSFSGNSNKGYDGHEESHRKSLDLPLSAMEEEMTFFVEVQKVKEMSGVVVVDFKRSKGDVWGFKRLYASVIGELPL
ncbi:kinase-like domain-containing protein [Chytriomyces cf. hyalinus JEL632]|nr:kinase-like domain-containing protein [Chytriomyces cf. hyalinus JEL632]